MTVVGFHAASTNLLKIVQSLVLFSASVFKKLSLSENSLYLQSLSTENIQILYDIYEKSYNYHINCMIIYENRIITT